MAAARALIRSEQLEADLTAVFARPETTAKVLRGERINASRRGKAEIYYDDATRALVAQIDPCMVQHFDYAHPGEARA